MPPKYQWIISEPAGCESLKDFPELSPLAVKLLIDRGLTSQDKIDEFLQPDYSQDIHNPYLFSQMTLAVNRLYQAKERAERVAVFGDYDADGVCGSAILHKTFTKLGLNFITYLPDREKEGYGLNEQATQALVKSGVKVLVTVDCGISNVKEVELANSLGLEVIITDHHHIPETPPPALAIIHPSLDQSYPFKHLAGGGTAFKLAAALLLDQRSLLDQAAAEIFIKWLLDLVAISTVADMVPLLGENRTLVKYGLLVLSKTKNLGLKKLIEVAAVNLEKIDAFTIGWQLAPRINAAGRMAHANTAYELLTTENIEAAITLAHGLNKRNLERQSLLEKLVAEAKQQLGEVKADQLALFAGGENWNAGVIGLVASKLTQDFGRPAIVFSFDGERYVASGRSIGQFNLIEALDNFSRFFVKYGGHSGAAGFSLTKKNWLSFKTAFTAYVTTKLGGLDLAPSLIIDLALSLKQADWSLVEILEQFKPYGEGNTKPRFLFNDLEVISAATVGQNNNHLRLMVRSEGLERKIICFGFGADCSFLKPGDKIEAVCELGVNEWNGNREIQLSLIDFKKR